MHLTVLLCPFGFANTTTFVLKHLELRVDSRLELLPKISHAGMLRFSQYQLTAGCSIVHDK